MIRLRSAASLARFVLAWFVLSVGVAVAAPLVQPNGLQLVCGGGAVKLVPQDEGGAEGAQLTLDCALCAPAVVPPPAERTCEVPRAHVGAPQAGAPQGVAASPALPPAARGPPGQGQA